MNDVLFDMLLKLVGTDLRFAIITPLWLLWIYFEVLKSDFTFQDNLFVWPHTNDIMHH